MEPTPGGDGPDPVVDWRESVARASPPPALTTVGPDFAVVHEGPDVRRYHGLEPGAHHELEGFAFSTLPHPGELLSTFATVNDVHFGEEVCGVIDGSDMGPTFRAEPGDEPYPEVMNRAVVAEMASRAPDAVLVKGDLTSHGTQAEYDTFRSFYEPAFGERLHVVRGNHESYYGSQFEAHPFQRIDLPGVTLVVLDTSVDGDPAGTVTAEQLDELDDVAAGADRPVLVFGHHHLGDRHAPEKADRTFGIDVDASEALVALVARRPVVRGYFAGHTHRNRVRRFAATGEVPWVEVACVKDFPGAWAEYRVHEQGILQIFHRISTPEALAWSERTRHMYEGLYEDYAFGSLADRCFAISLS
jgi:3',5'-cyclic AMP phosphodiesterase CpdA